MDAPVDCVFCKIAAGEIPSLKVFDDATTFAFLDINPLADGHLLVIPRAHYAQLDEMPDDEVSRVTGHLPRLARAVVAATGAEGYNILQNNGAVSGQAVMHVHFHIIPRTGADGLGYRWNAGQYPTGRDRQMHEAIVSALQS
jgi:histidine triad (HIT) family protein